MWLLIAEAFIALAMFVFIVWWTMSSRRRSETTALPPVAEGAPLAPEKPAVMADPANAGPSKRDGP